MARRALRRAALRISPMRWCGITLARTHWLHQQALDRGPRSRRRRSRIDVARVDGMWNCREPIGHCIGTPPCAEGLGFADRNVELRVAERPAPFEAGQRGRALDRRELERKRR